MAAWDVEVRSEKNIEKAEKFIVKHGGTVTNKFSEPRAGIFLLRAHMDTFLAYECVMQTFIKSVEPMARISGA